MKGERSARKSKGGNGVADPAALPYLLKAPEVATLLRTSTKAIYAMTERGLIPGAIRVGRRLLFRRDDLVRWLSESRAPSTLGRPER